MLARFLTPCARFLAAAGLVFAVSLPVSVQAQAQAQGQGAASDAPASSASPPAGGMMGGMAPQMPSMAIQAPGLSLSPSAAMPSPVQDGSSASAAQDCQTQIEGLSRKRMAQIEGLNALAKAGGGKLDPVKACPHLRELTKVGQAFITYLTKNKQACNVPDDALVNVRQGMARDETMSRQACAIAEQVRKAQQQGAAAGAGARAGGAQPAFRLPAGPL